MSLHEHRAQEDAEDPLTLPPPPGEVARRLRLCVRTMNQVSAADLAREDAEIRDALAEVAFSYGFARLSGVVHEIRRAAPQEPL